MKKIQKLSATLSSARSNTLGIARRLVAYVVAACAVILFIGGAASAFKLPDRAFGFLLICACGIAGALASMLDRRPENKDKLSELGIKREADWCTVISWVLGFPGVAVKVYSPIGENAAVSFGLIGASVFIGAYAALLKFRASNTAFEREAARKDAFIEKQACADALQSLVHKQFQLCRDLQANEYAMSDVIKAEFGRLRSDYDSALSAYDQATAACVDAVSFKPVR